MLTRDAFFLTIEYTTNSIQFFSQHHREKKFKLYFFFFTHYFLKVEKSAAED